MMLLEGIRVLDCSRVLAGPMATQTLADMGAEVLKVEPPDGDDTRTWGPPFQEDMAAYFQSCNRNKASLVLDLKTEAARTRLHSLATQAHVVIDNYPPAARAKLGLAPQVLAAQNPALVTMNITGYHGSRIDEPGYDIMVQAESGLMGITGPEDGPGYKTGVAVVDVLTGLLAANGILAGLLRAQRTGIGTHLSVSLYRTALMSLVNVASNYLVAGKPAQRWGNAHANIVPYQHFQAADRAVIIGCGNGRQYARLCTLLGIEPDPREADNAWRVAHREAVVARIAHQVAQLHSDDLLADLRAARIPCAPILNPAEALAAVNRWDDGALLALEHARLGTVQMVANPLVGDGMRTRHQPPPQLGEGGEALADAWTNAPISKK